MISSKECLKVSTSFLSQETSFMGRDWGSCKEAMLDCPWLGSWESYVKDLSWASTLLSMDLSWSLRLEKQVARLLISAQMDKCGKSLRAFPTMASSMYRRCLSSSSMTSNRDMVTE